VIERGEETVIRSNTESAIERESRSVEEILLGKEGVRKREELRKSG